MGILPKLNMHWVELLSVKYILTSIFFVCELVCEFLKYAIPRNAAHFKEIFNLMLSNKYPVGMRAPCIGTTNYE